MATMTANPWYREPWPWIILAILGLGVASGVSVLVVGLNNPPEMVAGDYAQMGKALVDTHERTDHAHARGLGGQISLDGERVTLDLASDSTARLPENLLIRFLDPARSDSDTTTLVSRQTDGLYSGSLASVPHERARVVVTDLQQSWSLAGRLSADTTGPVPVTPERL